MEIYKIIDELHLNLGCRIQKFEGGAGLPTGYSDRLAEEINLLLHGCGLFDLKACWLIALKGIDAGTYLQGMVTSDVLQLEVGEIQSSLICSNKGKIIHHLEIFRSEKDEWIVICDPGEGRAVGTILDNFHIREDLELRLLNSGEMLRIDLSGPDAEKIAELFWPGPITLILKVKDENIRKSLGLGKKIAVRVPNNQCVLSLLKECKLLVATSANISGTTSLTDPNDCKRDLHGYDLLLDGGILSDDGESTIVEIDRNKLRIVRSGSISEEELKKLF